MSNQPFPAPLPAPGDHPLLSGDTDSTGDESTTIEPTREADGTDVFDPDLNDDHVDSAAADILASGADPGD